MIWDKVVGVLFFAVPFWISVGVGPVRGAAAHSV